MTKCDPCESLEKCHLLSEVEIEALLQSEQLSHRWKIGKKQIGDDEYTLFISRKFTTKNFQAAMDYFNQIASIAEREGHHPDIHLTSYRDVEIVLYTHNVGGVTRNDIMLAKMFDGEVTIEYSPKWLRDNP